MTKTLTLKEARAVYGPDLPTPKQVAKGPVIMQRDGKPHDVVITWNDYLLFQELRRKAEQEAQRQAQDEAWEQERAAFQRLLPELLQTHRGLYVAVHGGQVVDADANNLSLAGRVISKLKDKPVYLQLVSENPRTFEVPSPEEVYRV